LRIDWSLDAWRSHATIVSHSATPRARIRAIRRA
jgi:hypothetical protein